MKTLYKNIQEIAVIILLLICVFLIPSRTFAAEIENARQHYTKEDGVWNGITLTLKNGEIAKNVFFCDGTYTYYLQYDGTPMKDRLTYHPNGKDVIYFDKDGHEVFSDFAHVKRSISGENVDDLCFFDVYGHMYVDFITYDKSGKELYYANPYGVIERNGWFTFSEKQGGGIGYANLDGTLMKGQFSYDEFGRLVYFGGDGKIAKGLISDGVNYYQMDEIDGHYLGQFPVEKNKWTITDYASKQYGNSMFYTIISENGKLIVVDGGWEADVENVRKVIKNLGNKVDAWIITHPHPDHAGAFLKIYSDPQGMEIDKVYVPNMPDRSACEAVAPWDTYETLEAFQKLNIPALQYVHMGDHFEIDGLKIDILSAYDNYVAQNSKDYLNDGSIMFKVTGVEQSMLFCADVGNSLSNYLLSCHGNNLKADYIQMGHHGNGGLSEEFYRMVSPQVAFFDAGEELMNPPSGSKFTTPQNRVLMQSLGAKIYYLNTEENKVILK